MNSAFPKEIDLNSGLGEGAGWNMRPSATPACAVDTARRGRPDASRLVHRLWEWAVYPGLGGAEGLLLL